MTKEQIVEYLRKRGLPTIIESATKEEKKKENEEEAQ